MNKKRKRELEKYYLQINRAYRDLKYMQYDSELGLAIEIKQAFVNVEKIRVELKRRLEEL
tara:strand:+ start:233 stop:412 length:180 start_codon:yes stop_codon:yes gene_type:complete